MAMQKNNYVVDEINKPVSNEIKETESGSTIVGVEDKTVVDSQKRTDNTFKAGALKGIRKEINEFFQNDKLWPYTEAILTIVLILFFAIFAIRPTVFAITSLLGEIKSRQEISRQMGEKIETLIEAQNSYFLVEQKRNLLDDFYPEKVNITNGAVQILGLALLNNVEISSLNFSKITFPDKTEEPGLIDFAFAGTGSYRDMNQFLASLFSSRRMVQIGSYSLKPEEEQEEINPEKINISIQGKLGFFVEKK